MIKPDFLFESTEITQKWLKSIRIDPYFITMLLN